MNIINIFLINYNINKFKQLKIVETFKKKIKIFLINLFTQFYNLNLIFNI